MRLVLAVLLLAACGPRAATGPAWPQMAERETDGGESLAPRANLGAVAAAADKDEDADDEAAKPGATNESDAKAADATDDKSDADIPAPVPAASDSEELEITGEEIVIEIDDEE